MRRKYLLSSAGRLTAGLLLIGLSLALAWPAAADIIYVIQYDDGNVVYYSGRPQPNDTCGVWFEPPTDSQILSGQFQFNNGMGGSALVFVWRLADDFDAANYYDNNESGWPGYAPSPLGEVLAGPIPYTFDDSGEWQEIVFDDWGFPPEDLDVGTDSFFIGYVLQEGNPEPYYPSILGDAGDERPYHSLAWLTNPGGLYPNESGWWAYGIDWMLRAKVNMYGDPPPFIEDLEDPPDTYLEGPYTITATIYDYDETGVPGSGEVTEARLIYSIDGEAEDTLIMTNTGGDTYAADIPALMVDQKVNFRVEADDDAGHTSVAPSVAGYYFTYRQPSGAPILLVNDSGSLDNETFYRDALDNNRYNYDYWYIDPGDPDDMGYPGTDVISVANYSSIIWFNGTAHLGSLPDNDADLSTDPVAQYMDAGGNFFLSSSDYIGGAFNPDDWDEFTAIPGTFMYEYLKVADGWSDAHLGPEGESQDTMYIGVEGDPVSDAFSGDYFQDHPDPNYNDYTWPTADGVTCFYTQIDDESAGIRYDGTYKMVFLPWVLEFCDDQDLAADILVSVLNYFGEGVGPVIELREGSQYGIYGNIPHDVVAVVWDPEDGVDYATISVKIDDGDWNDYPMTAIGEGKYSYSFPDPGVWSTIQYYITGVDLLGYSNVSPTYECVYTGWEYTPGANLLYCSDQPVWTGFEHPNYDSTITTALDGASGITGYDIWDVDEYGVPPDYWTVLSNYDHCIWVGYLDWNETFPMASDILTGKENPDHPFSKYLLMGKDLLFSSEEMFGVWTNWDSSYTFQAGDFAYDWFKVSEVLNDVNYETVEPAEDPMTNGMDAEIPLNVGGFPLGSMADFFMPIDWDDLLFWGTVVGPPPMVLSAGLRDHEDQYNAEALGFCLYMMDQDNLNQFIQNVVMDWLLNQGYPVGVKDEETSTPLTYQLQQNFPNPFNPITQIRFQLPEFAKVKLSVYNLMGQEVATLLDREMNPGTHTVSWDASQFASGVYFYKLKAANFEQVRKMILVK